MMPGTRLLRFARRWFPPSTVSNVFEPLVADWQRQWNDATPAQRRWINARGFAAFATTTVMMTPRIALATTQVGARPLVLAGGFWLLTSCLLTVFLVPGAPVRLLWLLLPGSLTMMLPYAVLPAIDAMRRDGGEPTHRQRRTALALIAVAVSGVALGQGWLTPFANQSFRNEMMSAQHGRPMTATRGVRELTTHELIAGEGSTVPPLRETERVREINMRLTLALLPAVLGWLRWQSLSRARRRSWPVASSCLLAIVATVAFILVMPAGPVLERLFVAPGFGPTLALGVFALTARTGIWWRHRTA